jgi:8-oxo-dGTP pyrophosphatase MutT (NUDIX family)
MAEGQRGEPVGLPNFGPPSEPRSAASIVLLRRGGKHAQRALEVLLAKRTPAASFMPNFWVFPGGSVETADGEGEAGCRACAIRELREEAGIELPEEEELVLFARWITPELIATRFDARFYLALAPAHAPPQADGVETVEARWFEPHEALEAADRGEIELAFPTVVQLGALAEHPTSDAAIAAFRNAVVEPILPAVVGNRENARVVLPDDPDYPR